MTRANDMSVYVQPASQTPMTANKAMGIPGMTASQKIVLGTDTHRVPSCRTTRYETATIAAAQTRTSTPQTVARDEPYAHGKTLTWRTR